LGKSKISTSDQPQPLSHHLEELRRRIFIFLGWFVLFSVLSYFIVDPILTWLARPVGEFVFTAPTEAFLIRIKMTFGLGAVFSFPVLIYQLWRYIEVALYAKERSCVGVEDVAALVGHSAEENAFELYQWVADSKFNEAFRVRERLKEEGYAGFEIMGSLVWQWERHLKVRNLLDQGVGRADISRELRIPEYYLDATIERARRMSRESVRQNLRALVDCDSAMKSGRLEGAVALDRCLVELSQA